MRFNSLSRFKSLKGKRVLVRVDFNIPLLKGQIGPEEEFKLASSVATVKRLSDEGAKVILISHLGRPKECEPELSLAPVVKRFAKLLGKKVAFIDDCLEGEDDGVHKKTAKMKDGDVVALENVRFYKGEEKNDVFFARRLASLADAYVNDAFAVCHRDAASTVGVAKLLPSAAGLLLEKEVKSLSKLLEHPKKPFIVLMSGMKISSKLPTLKNMLSIADKVLIAGGLAVGCYKALGYGTGLTAISADDVRLAKQILKKKNLVIPRDVVVTTHPVGKGKVRVAAIHDIRANEEVVDIGPESIRHFAAEIKRAKTIAWNGPVGMFEVKTFSHGTMALGRLIAARSRGLAFGVAGGGETVAALIGTGMSEWMDHISTGGGAMLEFLEGKTLPGIKPLLKK